jgi:Na+/proline symporter
VALVWRTLFAGQTAHRCPSCGRRFRLTYAAKRRVSYLNVALILGLTILAGFAFLGSLGEIAWAAAAYAIVAVIIALLLPRQVRYEKLTVPYR